MCEQISIVVPVYNEEGNLRAFYDELTAKLDLVCGDWEIIFVDDGSGDRSVELIKELREADQRVKLVCLARNFGHQVALAAGLDHAHGEAVITLDADLQHPVSLIPEMIARWKEGFDVVYTIRQDTEGLGFFKRFTASVFYRLINALTDTAIIPGTADFRLTDRKVVDCLILMKERSRFMRGLIAWTGFKQIGIPYVARGRYSGKSSYSLRRMLSFAVDGITSFSVLPLRLSAYVGFAAALTGVPYAIWAIYAKLFTETTVSGWTSVIVAVLFLGGVQLISLGVLGDYVGRIYEEVRGRPLYIARERIGFDAEAHARRLGHEEHFAVSSRNGKEA